MFDALWRLLRKPVRAMRAPIAPIATLAAPRRGERCAPGCDLPCDTPCRIADLPKGVRAIVVRVACPQADARRLEVLGLFAGVPVSIVDRRSGVLLEVRGARLAIASTLAASITAMPIR